MADFYPGFQRIQIGGSNPGAQGAAGFAKLGDMVGGGGEVAAQQAGAKAGYVGAETMNAIAQARQRQQEAQSRQQIGNMLDDDNSPVSQTLAAAGVTKGERATNAEMVRGGMPMGDIVGSIIKNHQGLATMANGALGNVGPQLAAAAPAEAIRSVTPSAGVPQPNPLGLNIAGGPQNIAPTQAHLGAETGELNAKAGLEHNEQVNPQLYHPNMFGASGMKVGDMTDDNWSQLVHATASGVIPPPTPGSRIFLQYGPQLYKDVMNVNPNFHGFDFAANAREASAVQGGQTALNTDSNINRVGQHITLMREAIKEINNGDVQASNWLTNELKQQFGSSAPTKLSEIGQFLGAEGVKSAAQMSAGSEAERDKLAASFSQDKSGSQLEGNAEALAGLVKGQVTARQQDWAKTGHKDSYVMRNLAPSTRRALGIPDEPVGGSSPAPAAKPGGAPAAPANQKAPGNGLPSVTDIDAELKRRGVQ